MLVAVGVAVLEEIAVGVLVDVAVGVSLIVGVVVAEGVCVLVGAGVIDAGGVGVLVSIGVLVCDGVNVALGLAVFSAVGVGVFCNGYMNLGVEVGASSAIGGEYGTMVHWIVAVGGIIDVLVGESDREKGSVLAVFSAVGVVGCCGVTVGTGVSRLLITAVTRADIFRAIGSLSLRMLSTRPRSDLSKRSARSSILYCP